MPAMSCLRLRSAPPPAPRRCCTSEWHACRMSRLTAPHGHRGAGRRVHVLGVACEQNPLHHLPRYPPPIRRPYPATSHRLRVLRHPVAAVHLVRESAGVRAPSLCGFQHFPGERVTGNCTLSATSRPARNPHQVAAPFQSLQWNRPPVKRHLATYIPVQSCFQADEAATRHTTRTTTTSTSE